MASAEIPYTGDTWVLYPSIKATETSYSGTNRTVYIEVYVTRLDFAGTTRATFSINFNGETYSDYTYLSNISPVRIYYGTFNVTVPNTFDSAELPLHISVTAHTGASENVPRTIQSTGNITIYGLTKIDEIPITSALDTTYGGPVSVSWTPTRDYVWNKLVFSMGGWSGQTEKLFQPGTTAPYTYTDYKIPMEAAEHEPNAEYGTMTVTLYTYSDQSATSQVGAPSTKTFNVRFAKESMPPIESCSGTTANTSTVVDGWGIALAGFSYITITAFVPAEKLYGSRVTKFNIEGSYIDYVTSTNTSDQSHIYFNAEQNGYWLWYNSGIIQSSGTYSFTLSYTDSRGITSAAVPVVFPGDEASVYFQEYQAPIIYSAKASKTAFADNTIEVKLDVSADYGAVRDSTGNAKNALTSTIYVKKDGVDEKMFGPSNSGATFTATLNRTLWLVDTSSYTIKLVMVDSLGVTAQKEIFLPSQVVMMDFKAGGDGLGIGKVCEAPGLEVSMKAKFYDDIYIQRMIDEHITTMSIEEFIRYTMNIISTSMYGDALPPNPHPGQLFFRRV